MYLLQKNVFFCVDVPIHLTVVKCPYLVKNGMKYGHFSGRGGLAGFSTNLYYGSLGLGFCIY